MEHKKAELDMRNVVVGITVVITHKKNVLLRIWLSNILLQMAGWIAPFEIDIED